MGAAMTTGSGLTVTLLFCSCFLSGQVHPWCPDGSFFLISLCFACRLSTWQLHLSHSGMMISCLTAEGPSIFADIIVSAGPDKRPFINN